jgi:hypothetical protein
MSTFLRPILLGLVSILGGFAHAIAQTPPPVKSDLTREVRFIAWSADPTPLKTDKEPKSPFFTLSSNLLTPPITLPPAESVELFRSVTLPDGTREFQVFARGTWPTELKRGIGLVIPSSTKSDTLQRIIILPDDDAQFPPETIRFINITTNIVALKVGDLEATLSPLQEKIVPYTQGKNSVRADLAYSIEGKWTRALGGKLPTTPGFRTLALIRPAEAMEPGVESPLVSLTLIRDRTSLATPPPVEAPLHPDQI